MSDSENNTTINGEEFILTVECGTNTAKLHLSKLRQGSRAACVMFEDRWLSPNQFQCVSGRRTTKDWKRSIRHAGKTLRQLMAQGLLTVEPASCVCSSCTGIPSSSDTDTPSISRLPPTLIRPIPTKIVANNSTPTGTPTSTTILAGTNGGRDLSRSPESRSSSRSPDVESAVVNNALSTFSLPTSASIASDITATSRLSANTPMINNIAMPGCTIIPEASDYATSLSGQWTNYYTQLFKSTLSAQSPLAAASSAASSSSSSQQSYTSGSSFATPSSLAASQLPVTSASMSAQQTSLIYQQYAAIVDFYSSAARGHGIDMAAYFAKLQQYFQQSPTAASPVSSSSTASSHHSTPTSATISTGSDNSRRRSADTSPALGPETKRRHFENPLDLSVRN